MKNDVQVIRLFTQEQIKKFASLSVNDFEEDLDLLGSGLIDSIGFIELFAAIEEEFEVQVNLESVPEEVFTSSESLFTYVDKLVKTKV